MRPAFTDVIIFSGQSNMQGQTEICPPALALPGAFEYRYLTDTVIPLAHPVGEDIGDGLLLGAHEGHSSLIPDFCRAYQSTLGDGREVLAIHVAKGATTVGEWLPPSARYDVLVEKVRRAIDHVACVGWVSFVWLQGESDAIIGLDESEYARRLEALQASLLRDLPIDLFGIIRVGKFVRDGRDLPIIRAQEALCRDGTWRMLTRVTALCTENPAYLNPFAAGHYSNAGMTLIGERAGANLARITRGEAVVLEEEYYEDMKA